MTDGGKPHSLRIRDLHAYYGHSHVIQGIDIAVDDHSLSIVGRNGMGKTTLCNLVTGLKRARGGAIEVSGRDITNLRANEVARLGVGYVPQGRRVWPSLSVAEHLSLASRRGGRWTIERVYHTFPRLAERRANGGNELSGGEQQMLAISRALLGNPRLLVMDEPTEGLSPALVHQVVDLLRTIVQDGDTTLLLIEQNLHVALSVSENVAILANGRIDRILPAAQFAADADLQQRLLGVSRKLEDSTTAFPNS